MNSAALDSSLEGISFLKPSISTSSLLLKGLKDPFIVIRRSPFIMIAISLVGLSPKIFFSPEEREILFGLAMYLELMSQLSFMVFIFYLSPLRLLDEECQRSNTPLFRWTQRDAWPLTKEVLRSAAHQILGLILFIIPGFLFYIWYCFVPYVVIFNQEYSADQRDALLHSKKLASLIWLRLSLLIFLSFLGLYLVDSWLIEALPLDEGSLRAVVYLVDSILALYWSCFFYRLYRALEPDSIRKEL